MEEAGIMMRLTGNLLDPQAEEFRPRNHPFPHTQITTLVHQPPQPQIYYQYPSSGVQVIPFCQQPPSPAYFRPTGPPPPPPLLHPPPDTVVTRSLLLSYVPVEVNEDTVRRELEVFGEVRSVQMERLVQEGIVTVHYYDLRQAVAAIMEIQQQHMKQQNRLRHHFNCWGFLVDQNSVPIPVPPPSPGLIDGQAVWAQFISPESTVNGLPDWRNQGTIVILNLDTGVSVRRLKEIFEAFGPVKEVRETPLKKHQRFVEYFDIRDAGRALSEMDGKEINGQFVTIEFSRPGGNRRRINSINNNDASISPPPSSINRNSFYTRVTPKLFRRTNSNSSSSNSSSQSHQHVKKSGFGSRGISSDYNNNNNGGGGCRRFSGIESSMGSLSLGVSGNGLSEEEESSFNGSGSSSNRRNGKYRDNSGDKQGMMMMKQPKARSWKIHNRLLKNSDSYFLIKDDAIMADSNIIRDPRTTVMIKNIPNKYSQKLLLNMLDNHCIHCNEQIISDGDDQHQPLSAYDFVYLPIDFNNKCNVGYGFVNMTSSQATLRLYKTFHLQQWEVFNSRKICEVTYARLQGLEALKEHFKNSKFACETDEYLPVVFSPPRDGKQLTDPIPMGGHSRDLRSPLAAGNTNMKILLSSAGGSSTSSSGCCNSAGLLRGGGDDQMSEMEVQDRKVDDEKKKDDENVVMSTSFKVGCGYDEDNAAVVDVGVGGKTQLIPNVGVISGKKKKKMKSAQLPNGCLASSSEPLNSSRSSSRSSSSSMLL